MSDALRDQNEWRIACGVASLAPHTGAVSVRSSALIAIDAELTRLRADFAALQYALVGNTGASAILAAESLVRSSALSKRDAEARAALTAPAVPAAWRKLALQWDAQRMSALWHLKALLQDPEHAAAAREFLAAAPQAPAPSGD